MTGDRKWQMNSGIGQTKRNLLSVEIRVKKSIIKDMLIKKLDN